MRQDFDQNPCKPMLTLPLYINFKKNVNRRELLITEFMQITINLSKKQFERLLKIAYLGEWMINANRDNPLKEYEEIDDLIFSLAGQFGLEKYYTHEPRDGNRYYPSRIFEEGTDVRKFHEVYDEETFWDELIDRLGERDFYRHYAKNELRAMTQKERFIKVYEFIDRWEEEINKNGIEKLGVVENKN